MDIDWKFNGKIGAYADMNVSGAYKNGTKIIKIKSETGDTHEVGATGTVIGSLINEKKEMGYFVNWDDEPDLNVFVVAYKIAELTN